MGGFRLIGVAHWPGLHVFGAAPASMACSTDPIQVAAFTVATLSPLSVSLGLLWARSRSLLLVALWSMALIHALPHTAERFGTKASCPQARLRDVGLPPASSRTRADCHGAATLPAPFPAPRSSASAPNVRTTSTCFEGADRRSIQSAAIGEGVVMSCRPSSMMVGTSRRRTFKKLMSAIAATPLRRRGCPSPSP